MAETMPNAQLLDTIAARLASAHSVVVLTGAGVSAESGVPTFRDAQTGLWTRYDPQQLATPEAFAADPALVWRWYIHRRTLVRRAEPNAGHWALAELAQRLRDVVVVTQNVDGLHRRAGSRDVIELHGNLMQTRRTSDDAFVSTWDETQVPPVCPDTGALLRPNVVWFGEMLPARALETALARAQNCDVFLAVGTSGVVYPAASLAPLARDHGATLVEINPEPTALSAQADYVVRATSARALPALTSNVARQLGHDRETD